MFFIINYLLPIDRSVFNFLYHLHQSLFLNWVMNLFSLAGISGGVWLIIAAIAAAKQEKKRVVLLLFVSLLFSFGLVEFGLKPLFARNRPLTEYERIPSFSLTKDSNQFSQYSFPSGHATSSFQAAFILSHFTSHKIALYLLALCISISRIYLGCHYPLDIIAGTALGLALGHFSLCINRTIIRALTARKEN